MSAYEANWETGIMVTAEAVFGIGFPSEVKVGIRQTAPAELMQERPETAAQEAAE